MTDYDPQIVESCALSCGSGCASCALCAGRHGLSETIPEKRTCAGFLKWVSPKSTENPFLIGWFIGAPIVQESTMSVNLEVPCIQTSSKIMINMSKDTWEMVDGCLTVISRTLNLIYHANFGIWTQRAFELLFCDRSTRDFCKQFHNSQPRRSRDPFMFWSWFKTTDFPTCPKLKL